jgi:CHAD domain-containing protein
VAKAQEIDLSPDESYGDAAAKVIRVRAVELTEQARGVLDTGDIDRVHDMRVATRRLRAALEVFEPCFPGKAHRRAVRDVKRLADGLGERRDRDVAIAALAGFNDQMHVPDRKGVASLIDRLRDEQAQANLDLAPMVDRANLEELSQALSELVDSAKGRRAPDGDGGEA